MKKIIVLLTLVFGFSSVFATTDAVTAKSGHHNRLQSTVHKWYDSAKEKAKQKWPEVKEDTKKVWDKTKDKTKEWYHDVKEKFKKDPKKSDTRN